MSPSNPLPFSPLANWYPKPPWNKFQVDDSFHTPSLLPIFPLLLALSPITLSATFLALLFPTSQLWSFIVLITLLISYPTLQLSSGSLPLPAKFSMLRLSLAVLFFVMLSAQIKVSDKGIFALMSESKIKTVLVKPLAKLGESRKP